MLWEEFVNSISVLVMVASAFGFILVWYILDKIKEG